MTFTTPRRFLVPAIVAIAGFVLFLLWREGTIVREGEPLALHATGRVFDRATGEPIPGAWVLLGLHSSHSTLGGYGGGCTDGSAVVKTDANGAFAYDATVAKAGNGNSAFWTVVYHPDYAGELTWGSPSVPGVATFPLRHLPSSPPLSIGLAKRDIDEWDALRGIYDYSQQACLLVSTDRGHAAFSRMRYDRTLALHCGSTPRARPFPLLDVMDELEARLRDLAMYAMPPGPARNWPEHNNDIARMSYVSAQLLPNYPWALARNVDQGSPRDPTAEEKAAFCAFYALPIENLINREFLP